MNAEHRTSNGSKNLSTHQVGPTKVVRVPPVQKPRGLLLKLMYWLSRRLFGKIASPLSIIYTRIPGFIVPHLWLANYGEMALSLDKRLCHLTRVWVSTVNSCSFTTDMMRYTAAKDGIDLALLDALPAYETNAIFTDRERGALSYCEELSRRHTVGDEVFDRARQLFNEKELVELTFLASHTNFINLLALPLGLKSDELCALLPPEKRSGMNTAVAAK